MKAVGYKTISVKLELDELEAIWLKNRMQNPFVKEAVPINESQTDKTMRETFWKALDEAGVPSK